jgi:hypothetical protein
MKYSISRTLKVIVKLSNQSIDYFMANKKRENWCKNKLFCFLIVRNVREKGLIKQKYIEIQKKNQSAHKIISKYMQRQQ